MEKFIFRFNRQLLLVELLMLCVEGLCADRSCTQLTREYIDVSRRPHQFHRSQSARKNDTDVKMNGVQSRARKDNSGYP